MRGIKAKRLRKLGLKAGPVKSAPSTEEYVPGTGFDHAQERRSKKNRKVEPDA